MLQILLASWQALLGKTCSLYSRTASWFSLVIDPFIGGPYWVYYPCGTCEWAVTSYAIFIILYTKVGSLCHTICCKYDRLCQNSCVTHSSHMAAQRPWSIL